MRSSCALPLAAMAVLACSDPAGDDCHGPCDDVFPDDPDASLVCDPTYEANCLGGRKCAFVLDDLASGSGIMSCVADGTIAVGGACVPATAIGEADDCVRGSHCYGGICTSFCGGSLECLAVEACVAPSGSFSRPLCRPTCDPLVQDCPTAGDGQPQGCYVDQLEGPACLIVRGAGEPAGGTCVYSDECSPGTQCTGLGECLTYCDPNGCGSDAGSGMCPECAGGLDCTPYAPGVGLCTAP
jgi:hypothetical protein